MLWPASVQIYGLKNSMRHKEGLFVQDRHLMKPGLRIGSTKRLPMCLQCHNIYLHSRSSECHRLTKSIAMSNKISKCVWTAIPLTQSPQQQQYVVVLVIIIYRSTARINFRKGSQSLGTNWGSNKSYLSQLLYILTIYSIYSGIQN